MNMLAHTNNDLYTHHMYGNTGWYGWIGLLFWVVIFAVVGYAAFRYMRKPSHNTSLLDIAKERYAKGEISKKEFEEIKKDIAK